MPDETLRRLWEVADDQRGRVRSDLAAVLKAARELGIPYRVEHVTALATALWQRDRLPCPDWVADFIGRYLEGRGIKRILDPCAGLGTLLIPVVERLNATGEGWSHNAEECRLAATIQSTAKLTWTSTDPFDGLETAKGRFDVILSFPPFGLHREPASSPKSELHGLKDDPASVLALRASLSLREGGVAVFLVPPSFAFPDRPRSVISNLTRLGANLDAYISLPPGTLKPYTALPSALAFFSRDTQSDLFVGELTPDRRRAAVLLKNLKSGKGHRELGLGRLVPLTAFKGYPQLVAEDRVNRMAQRLQLEALRLVDVVTEVNLTKSPDPSGFEERPNAVYLPMIGRSRAVASLADLSLKAHNYAQLVVTQDVGEAEYVAEFLSTPLGLALREQVQSGTIIPKLSKRSLAGMRLFLPDRQAQVRTLEANARLDALTNEIKDLKSQLWSRPREIERTARSIGAINREDRLQDWLDAIPFPLASILWTHHTARGDEKAQYEHLLHFFEALAEFVATILLSAFAADPELLSTETRALADVLEKRSLSYEKASFGTWKAVVEYLAKRTRELLSKEETKERAFGLFATRSPEVLDLVVSKRLVSILQETNSLRNDWTGHGGVVGERDAHERHVALMPYLGRIRDLFGSTWEEYELVRPGRATYRHGVYRYTADRIVGVKTPFEKRELKMALPMEDGHLHLFSRADERALRLLPLVTVTSSPKTAQNACYFYNREEKDGIRFVSYHFEDEAERVDAHLEARAALRLINPQTSRS